MNFIELSHPHALAALGYIAATVMGITLGLLGGGGAILTVPILVYLFGHVATRATQESLLIVGLVSGIGTLPYIKRGLVEFKTGLTFALPALAGVAIARRVILPQIPAEFALSGGLSVSKDTLLMGAFAVVMMLAARAMLFGRAIKATAERAPPLQVGAQGFGVGAITGFLGAGGGFLIVPALVGLLKLPMDRAVGTSLLIITLNSLFGFTMSLGQSSIPSESWPFLAGFTLLAALGILLGSRLNQKVPAPVLKKAFGWFILGMGSLILLTEILRR